MDKHITELVKPIREDLLSGAAELALRAITILQGILTANEATTAEELKSQLTDTVQALIDAQPAMTSIFISATPCCCRLAMQKPSPTSRPTARQTLDKFEPPPPDSAAAIAEHAYSLIPPGELVFAYSFSSYGRQHAL